MKYESVHCYQCAGAGTRGKIDKFGRKTIKSCGHCKGIGRRYCEVGSEDWRLGKQVIHGLGTRVRYR